jgi:squalene monooxygenase
MHINMDEKNEQRRMLHHEADVVVVGAGILGCAVAVALGNQGRSVIVLERSLKEPDRIVGELLQPGGVQALEKLGLRDCLEDIDAVKVFGYDVIYYGNEVLCCHKNIYRYI